MDSKEVIKAGFAYLKDFFPNDKGILLEEIEQDTNNGNWLITYSLPGISEGRFAANPLLEKETKRRFKVLTINPISGEILSMKIRELHDVR